MGGSSSLVTVSDGDAVCANVNWQADWIWFGDEAAPFHYFLYVKRNFDLAAAPAAAALHITATDRYRLFVNGVYLGRGPERCDARFQSYDTHDLSEVLRAGGNCIAVQLYFYGCSTGYTRDGRGGLLAQLETAGDGKLDGPRTIIGTDERWRVRPAEAWQRDARPTGGALGVTEVYDARADPVDWMMPEFDDSTWASAQVVPASAGEWCSRPAPRHVPFLLEDEARPARVLGTGEVLEIERARTTVDIPELMAREIHQELQYARLDNAEALTADDEADFTVAATSPHALGDDVFNGIHDPIVLLDFGRQINAYPRFTVEGSAGSIVDMTYSEQLIGGRIAPLLCSTRFGDRYILREGLQTFESFEYKSFRYLQLTFRTDATPVKVHSVSANTWRYPAEVRGRFESSDEVLDRLWTACVVTTDLCTDDAFMDTPMREKRNWLGDGSHAVLGAIATWGDVSVIRRYFTLATQGGLGDGLPRMFFPGSDSRDPATGIIKVIPHHAVVWAARVWEYYRYTGDADFLDEMYPTLIGLAGWCDRHANNDGLLDRLPGWCWLDWTPSDIRGANFGTNAFMLGMLDDMAKIAHVLGRAAESVTWAKRAERVRTSLHDLYWDEARGVFQDSLIRGRPTGVASELGNALGLLLGIADAEQRPRVAGCLESGAEWLARATPLFFHYVAQALFDDGRGETATRMVRDRFEPMLSISDTLWEDWFRHAQVSHIDETMADVPDVVPEGRFETVVPSHRGHARALAHCGAVGLGFMLLTEVLGIQPKEAGFDGCVIKPRLGVLDHAAGTLPTRRGDISVSWRQSGKHKTLAVSLPDELEGELHLPAGDIVSLSPGDQSLDVS
ncbi:MAG: hypothetical protein CMJ49_07285 [Planctomycetaceae bacterium]|nr:hypothetical protein [Planctomycetaceae bacterium]